MGKDLRRCSLISMGQMKQPLGIQSRRRSMLKPTERQFEDLFSQQDEMLSRADPLPEKFVKDNIKEPNDRRRPSLLLG